MITIIFPSHCPLCCTDGAEVESREALLHLYWLVLKASSRLLNSMSPDLPILQCTFIGCPRLNNISLVLFAEKGLVNIVVVQLYALPSYVDTQMYGDVSLSLFIILLPSMSKFVHFWPPLSIALLAK